MTAPIDVSKVTALDDIKSYILDRINEFSAALGGALSEPKVGLTRTEEFSLGCLAKATGTTKSAALLFANNSQRDAVSLKRDLLELCLRYAWAVHDAGKVEQRLDLYEYEKTKKLLEKYKTFKKVEDKLPGGNLDATIAQTEAEIAKQEAALKANYGTDVTTKDGNIKRLSVESMFREVGDIDIYDAQYRDACDQVHSNGLAIDGYIKKNGANTTFELCPSDLMQTAEATICWLHLLQLASTVDIKCPGRLPESVTNLIAQRSKELETVLANLQKGHGIPS